MLESAYIYSIISIADEVHDGSSIGTRRAIRGTVPRSDECYVASRSSIVKLPKIEK